MEQLPSSDDLLKHIVQDWAVRHFGRADSRVIAVASRSQPAVHCDDHYLVTLGWEQSADYTHVDVCVTNDHFYVRPYQPS